MTAGNGARALHSGLNFEGNIRHPAEDHKLYEEVVDGRIMLTDSLSVRAEKRESKNK